MTGTPRAQLISPGDLTSAHAHLEGVRNCTNCHQIGQRGIDPGKCLSCHTPLRTRIHSGSGLHANLSRQCGSCHKDHAGRNFEPIRFNQNSFNHTQTGFRLTGEHRSVTCRTCHTPSAITDNAVRRFKGQAGRLGETFLGLPDDCATCHEDDNPHGAEFSNQTCDSCHKTDSWNDVPNFDHSITGFSLTGRHSQATCASCHGNSGQGVARFQGLSTSCASCHRNESNHSQTLNQQNCATCHSTGSWSRTSGFRHSATRFSLDGQHAQLSCESCHTASGRTAARFRQVEDACETCHSDENPHGVQFQDRSCASCHTAATWESAPNFDHNNTEFPLTGSHAPLDCASCHPGSGPEQQFAGTEFATCATCHDDAHEGELGTDCATCHTTASWERMGSTFDESRFNHEAQTGYPLLGSHLRLDCASCHASPGRDDDMIAITLVQSGDEASFPRMLADDCQSCHRDYHDGVFLNTGGGTICENCHSQDSWIPTTFDLARHSETNFPLSGGHLATPCSSCHLDASAELKFDLQQTCESCHADLNPHEDEFEDPDGVTRCASCHNTSDWDLAQFDHSQTGFALTGSHVNLTCGSCHTTEIRPDGHEVRRFEGLENTCASCHSEIDPHQGQFDGQSCNSCHDTEVFTIARFDHSQARFQLEGAHANVSCGSCHVMEESLSGTTFVRFKPLGTACEDCHSQ